MIPLSTVPVLSTAAHKAPKGSMASLVEELQRDVLDPHVRVSDLLRKARTIAHKLSLPDFAAWIENELNGYSDGKTLPAYRSIRGRIKGHNPFYGWQPVMLGDAEFEEAISTYPIGQKVAELEDLITQNNGRDLVIH
jgi:hypothetical protein